MDLEGFVSLCKRRGFVFPSGEVAPTCFACSFFKVFLPRHGFPRLDRSMVATTVFLITGPWVPS